MSMCKIQLRILDIALFFVWMAVGTKMVMGFTIDEALTNGTPSDPSDDLSDAARWSNVQGSLVEHDVRGLGGGIEYAIAGDFCTNIIPRFIDEPKPTCGQLKEAIKKAFDKWASGHSALKFADVTGKIQAARPPSGEREPWRGFGAEIDFFAFPYRLGAHTEFWFLFADPIGTNGKVLPGNTLTSADIIVNTNVCFHLDPALAGRGCNHFESLILHEIGHAIALDHPNEFPQRNFDTDNNPTNEISIDCKEPTKGLRLSSNIEQKAVMEGSLGKPEPVRPGLTQDDLGGRNFLYPTCPSSATTPDVGATPTTVSTTAPPIIVPTVTTLAPTTKPPVTTSTPATPVPTPNRGICGPSALVAIAFLVALYRKRN